MSAVGAIREALEALEAGPLRLPENRVARFYSGGALLDRFRGMRAATDADRPEDWVGSVTAAWTLRGNASSTEGLSIVPDLDGRLLREILDAAPEGLIGRDLSDALRRAGAEPTTGLLVKLLDTASRLPVHAHPTRPFARRALGSFFGKTEAWLIIGTRRIPDTPSARVWLGFARDVSRDELLGWIRDRASERLLAAMHEREVSVGDAWLVPGGIPHAIGAGAFIVELQEPTDLSIVAEVRDFPVADVDAHLGFGWEVAVDAIDRRGWSSPELDALRQAAVPVPGGEAVGEVRLLGRAADPFFRATRLHVDADVRWPYAGELAVCIVTDGSASIAGPRRSIDARPGTTFLVPAASASAVRVIDASGLRLIVCRPPHHDALA